MASSSVTIRDGLNDLSDRLQDARVLLDLLTDIQPDPDAQKLHSGALTAFRLVADAIEAFEAVEAQA